MRKQVFLINIQGLENKFNCEDSYFDQDSIQNFFPFWVVAPKGQYPVGHRGDFPYSPSVGPSLIPNLALSGLKSALRGPNQPSQT